MYKLVIQGGNSLNGRIKTSGSKNATLPILFSSILADDPLKLANTPQLSDVSTALRLLMDMGANFILEEDGAILIDSSNLDNLVADYSLVKTMRASILTLGPMLTKYKKAKVSLPGGCAIGTRPVDLHLNALEKMGAIIELKNGYIYAKTKELKGAQIHFDLVSVTATENIIMAATLAKGITTIGNAAQEPEVTDLIHCLNKMGAKITGENSSTLIIEGVDRLSGTKYNICPDRIEAGTYLVAAAITGGCITVDNIEPDSMRSVIGKLIETGADIKTNKNSVYLDMKGRRPQAVDIRTSVYPNFPTDMQAQFVALNSIAKGSSIITETIFENRFMHVPEINRMGANLKLEGNTVVCKGVKSLKGANLMATDLRASASLVLAGLAAEGSTTIERVYHLDRGYEMIEEKFKMLGADIERVQH
ncbi:MAG: UDP-N-acetylglucosamine 1-carboxyvinyltransferase [Gammaproteobacteria bacterium]|nr:UDP-N-acetylglucosamine 1-carboxyvinyltransferase [Gammaproteobacteria bacterium]